MGYKVNIYKALSKHYLNVCCSSYLQTKLTNPVGIFCQVKETIRSPQQGLGLFLFPAAAWTWYRAGIWCLLNTSENKPKTITEINHEGTTGIGADAKVFVVSSQTVVALGFIET